LRTAKPLVDEGEFLDETRSLHLKRMLMTSSQQRPSQIPPGLLPLEVACVMCESSWMALACAAPPSCAEDFVIPFRVVARSDGAVAALVDKPLPLRPMHPRRLLTRLYRRLWARELRQDTGSARGYCATTVEFSDPPLQVRVQRRASPWQMRHESSGLAEGAPFVDVHVDYQPHCGGEEVRF
jgi:hypothetical protein